MKYTFEENRHSHMLIYMGLLIWGGAVCAMLALFKLEFQYAALSVYFFIAAFHAFNYSDKRKYEIWDEKISESPIVTAALALIIPAIALIYQSLSPILGSNSELFLISFLALPCSFFLMPIIQALICDKARKEYAAKRYDGKEFISPIPPLWFPLVLYTGAVIFEICSKF